MMGQRNDFCFYFIFLQKIPLSKHSSAHHSSAHHSFAMPILCPLPIARLSREEFLERDALVMKCAYATQNKLGRLCEERVYENDLAFRLRASGMKSVHTQVPIRISHQHFQKEYRLDLVADDAVYELKTVSHLTGEHDCQIFAYGMCLDVPCVKLLNFRNSKVEGRIRFVPVDHGTRHACHVETSGFQPLSVKCPQLPLQLTALVADIGGYLEARLYEEALGCLTTAPLERLSVRHEGNELGTHGTRLLTPGVGFYVSAFTDALELQHTHLQRLLAMLPLKGLHWINFNHGTITVETLNR
jgi:GxxExxY protein